MFDLFAGGGSARSYSNFWNCPDIRLGIVSVTVSRRFCALGKKAEVVRYDEASRGLNQPDSVIDRVSEEILIASGLHEEAYQHYGLSTAVGNSYITRFRVVAKRHSITGQS